MGHQGGKRSEDDELLSVEEQHALVREVRSLRAALRTVQGATDGALSDPFGVDESLVRVE